MAGLAHCRLPTPQPLSYTTPSGASDLGECMLRAAYASDSAFRETVPSSPAARLGTVCHRVLELAGRGKLAAAGDPNWRQTFDDAWTAAIDEQDAERRRNPLEAHWPPPERWPYYAARKVATRRLCERMCATQTSGGGDGTSQQTHRERRREALGGELRGKADVVRTAPEPEIEDYKTGSLADAETGEIKERYRTQMLLYAVLEHEVTGVWPKRATLIPLQGEPRVIEIDPREATAAAETALNALHTYNEKVASGTRASELAAPSVEACRYCAFAIQCPAFWSVANETWSDEGIVAVAGPLRGREKSRLSSFNLRIGKAAGSVPDGEYLLYQLDAERFGAVLSAPEDAEVAAVWLTGDSDARQLRAGARTQITFA